jgi:hypothetical protein
MEQETLEEQLTVKFDNDISNKFFHVWQRTNCVPHH